MDNLTENRLFLEAVGSAVKGISASLSEEKLSEEEWSILLKKAEKHHILPMIYESVHHLMPSRDTSPVTAAWHKRSIKEVTLQTIKTEEFLSLYSYLSSHGITPAVVKGIICRELYPNPDFRISGDEDLLVSENKFIPCHELFLEYGMQTKASKDELMTASDIAYTKPGSPLYIELHRSLFPSGSAPNGLSELFLDALNNSQTVSISGVSIVTLNPTYHLLYLICHSFKHFIHSGFGIRQICDIALFAEKHSDSIDRQYLLCGCRKIRAEEFASAVFGTAVNHLGFDGFSGLELTKTNCEPLLLDLLDSGIYGSYESSRIHSSNMTLNAVKAQKSGGFKAFSALKALFPPASYLSGKYPYLKKYPVLLPAAWISRIITYNRSSDPSTAAQTVKTGNRRIELLKFYKIID